MFVVEQQKAIKVIRDHGNSMADTFELLMDEPEKADVYREAINHACVQLELLDTYELGEPKISACLVICGQFDDLGKCGNCDKQLGSLSFIYDCGFEYCPYCGAKLYKEVPYVTRVPK